MTPPIIFGLLVRAVGLVFLAYSVMYLYWLVAAFVGDKYTDEATEFAIATIGMGLAAWGFLRGASRIVRFTYPDAKTEQKDRTPNKVAGPNERERDQPH